MLHFDPVFFIYDFIRGRAQFIMELAQQDIGSFGSALLGFFSVFLLSS